MVSFIFSKFNKLESLWHGVWAGFRPGAVHWELLISIRSWNDRDILLSLIMSSTLAKLYCYQALARLIIGLSCLVFPSPLCNLHKSTRSVCKKPSDFVCWRWVSRRFYLIAVVKEPFQPLDRTPESNVTAVHSVCPPHSPAIFFPSGMHLVSQHWSRT